MSHPVLSEFDIVFAGGGTTACVVAGRLAAYDPSLRILVLEAGQHSLNKPIHVQPALARFNLEPESTTVTFNIGNPSPALNGHAPTVACGRCVGGGSCVNFMVYTRPPASDYDDWGVTGWESENLIPLMKKLETYEVQPGLPTHGYDGPIKASSGAYQTGIFYEFIQVGTTYHKRQYADDTDDLETCNTYSPCHKYIQVSGATEKRSDAAHHYIYNQAHNPNLQVWDGKRVKRVIFEDKRAVGVEFTNDPVSCPDADQSSSIVRALKLVVVSGGAFGSPAILERSGIGAEAVLTRCGIEQLVNLPGVGENYRDHNVANVPYLAADKVVTTDTIHSNADSHEQCNSCSKPLVAQIGGLNSKIKWRPDDEELKAMGPAFQPRWKEFFQNRPEKAVALFAPVTRYVPSLSRPLSSIIPPGNYMTASYFTLYPASIGSVHINMTENGKEGIDFNTGFLDDPSDIIPLDFSYKKMREVFRRMASYRGEFTAGHPDFPEGSAAACREASGPVDLNAPDLVYTPEDDEAISRFHRDIIQTTWHSLGTCAMKSEADQGVVDARLNVYGVTNLKVADLSICPLNIGTNTYATALVIGERAAMIIAEDLGINCI